MGVRDWVCSPLALFSAQITQTIASRSCSDMCHFLVASLCYSPAGPRKNFVHCHGPQAFFKMLSSLTHVIWGRISVNTHNFHQQKILIPGSNDRNLSGYSH